MPPLRPAAFLALERADHDRLGHVEHVPELDRRDHVLVEHRPAVVDRRLGGLLLEPADDLVRLGQPVLVAEHRDVLVHGLAELVLDRADPPAALRPVHDRVDVLLGVGHA